MSDLVTKVFDELKTARNAPWRDDKHEARLAIKAVLSHYSDPRNISDRMADARLTELNIDDIRSNHRTAIAAAMAAALKQLEGSE